ncbi:MAG: class III poly(R)-hydroxyalkanoic acid synthase subunit PhaC [Pseudomonadota bacterium]
MQPFNIQPEQLAEEMSEYTRKLASAVENILLDSPQSTGVTERMPVYSEDKLVLYRYKAASQASSLNPVPLLIIYALVNRPYMTDLDKNRSTIANLLKHGQDVYLIDWGYPDEADRCLTLEDYISGYINRCVDIICKNHSLKKINILGICQGGSFSLCYTSLYQNKVKNLVTMVSPVDFKTPDNLLSAWVQHIDIDNLVDTLGNIPGEMLNWTFLSLKPFTLTAKKYVDMVDVLEDETLLKNFLRIEKWIFDSPAQAGETFRQFLKDFYQKNGLIEGGIKLGEQLIDLKNIRCPVLNIYAEHDHLVPPDASRALNHRTSTKDYTELGFPGGHIGIYVSGKAQAHIVPAICDWLDQHT